MSDLLHLGPDETLRVVSEEPAELEVEATWTPGGTAPPDHLHPDQEERFEVKLGILTAVVDGTTKELWPGDTLEIPARTPHRMWNRGSEDVTAVWRTRPALRTADWFRTIDRLSEGGTRKPPLPGMAKAVTQYSDVFRLVIRPKPLQPLAYAGLRVLGLLGR